MLLACRIAGQAWVLGLGLVELREGLGLCLGCVGALEVGSWRGQKAAVGGPVGVEVM